MNKPHKLNKGDKVAVVSLSRGLLGMPFIKHELDLGIKRLNELGLEPVFMPNALKDMDYVENHPENRASDLKEAFLNKEIKGIITAIGGNDTYKTILYLMEDEEFINAVKNNPKIFIGFSDTTNNHLMLNKLGLNTIYGPCFLADIAELDKEMLPYTKEYFNKLFENENGFEIKSSPILYYDREDFGPSALGTPRKEEKEIHGFETINGSGVAVGRLYGGCIESLYEMYTGENQKEIFKKYNILPTLDEWKEKILFIETSEEAMEPSKLEDALTCFKNEGILQSVKGIIVGKPIDEKYYEEYKEVYTKIFVDIDTPVLFNVNFGHAVPRCIIPYNALAKVDYDNKTITIEEKIFED